MLQLCPNLEIGNAKIAWVMLNTVRKRRPSTESFIKYRLKNDGAEPTACGVGDQRKN